MYTRQPEDIAEMRDFSTLNSLQVLKEPFFTGKSFSVLPIIHMSLHTHEFVIQLRDVSESPLRGLRMHRGSDPCVVRRHDAPRNLRRCIHGTPPASVFVVLAVSLTELFHNSPITQTNFLLHSAVRPALLYTALQPSHGRPVACATRCCAARGGCSDGVCGSCAARK